MRAASTKTKARTAGDLYRACGLPDDRSARARAEEQLTAVLYDHPSLAPEGWCNSPALIDKALRFRAEPNVVLKPKLVEAFAWCRTFLMLGCRQIPRNDWNSTTASQMAFQAEMAGVAANGRQVPIEQGVAIAAAYSLGIDVMRDDEGSGTWLAAYTVWERRR